MATLANGDQQRGKVLIFRPRERDPRAPQTIQEAARRSPEGALSHWLDELIGEAMKKGDFDDLPGKGKPLHIDDPDPFGGPEAVMYKVLKNAGFRPDWIDLRRTISEELAWLRALPDHPDRAQRIQDLNEMIGLYNDRVPRQSLALPRIPRDFGGPQNKPR